MESLAWTDVLKEMVASGDDPLAAAARFTREADQREREADALRNLSVAIQELVPAKSTGQQPVATDEGKEGSTANGGPPSAVVQQPRGAVIDTIRAIMRAGGTWTPKALLAEMEKRNVVPNSKTPIRSVESAVNRLWRGQNAIKRVGTAQYVWAEGHPASPSLETLGEYADPIGTSIAAMKDLPASESEAKE